MLSLESKPIVGGATFFKERELPCAWARELALAFRPPELVDRSTWLDHSDLGVREL